MLQPVIDRLGRFETPADGKFFSGCVLNGVQKPLHGGILLLRPMAEIQTTPIRILANRAAANCVATITGME